MNDYISNPYILCKDSTNVVNSNPTQARLLDTTFIGMVVYYKR